MKPPVIFVTGPTASGKSAIALEIACAVGGEIVNADSVQVYKDFDIGAAKPSAEEFKQVPHHLYSFVDPREEFNVGKFRNSALHVIAEIHARKKIPIVAGGSGLYVRALLTGLVEADTDDEEAQEKLSSVTNPYELLCEIDPQTAARLPENDLVRIRRALLVYFATGAKLSELQAQHQNQTELPYRAFVLSVELDREVLYQRIDARVDAMFAAGLVEEVRSLMNTYPASAQPFRSLGYRHVLMHLRGEIDFDSMKEQMKRDTRHFAKRQLTWWRNQPKKMGWIVKEPMRDPILVTIKDFLARNGCTGELIEFQPFPIGHSAQSLL